jgi:rhamnosyltransferase
MSKFAAVIVTYFPDANAIENLGKVSGLCDAVVVIDNTPERMRVSFPDLNNITVWKPAENVGLASALNIGMRLAAKQGVENVFLLDQDSRPPHRYFQDMLDFKAEIDRETDNWAFYVPNFYDRNSKTFGVFPLLGRLTLRHATCEDLHLVSDDRALIAITSGMLITVAAYRKIGAFRDDYFIDFIDNEYCLRAGTLGLSIAVNCDIVLDHSIGNRSLRRFCGLTIKPNNHLPTRRYYMSRNGIRTTIDYFPRYPCYAVLILARLVHETLSIILYENRKWEKIMALLLGAYHGVIGKMGKCQFAFLK